MRSLILALILLAGLARSLEDQNFRLPTSIVPIHYDLKIRSYLEPDFKFDGEVSIKVECNSRTNNITLHSAGLDINFEQVSVTPSSSKESQLNIKDQYYELNYHFYIIYLEEYLEPGQQYVLRIPFSGSIVGDVPFGFHRSCVENRCFASTQFEQMHAREAFPCFDEPWMRAGFTITLGHKRELKSISNMPLVRTEPMEGEEGWVWSYFQESVPMSTYLVAYVIGDLTSATSPTLREDLTIRIWTFNDDINATLFAQNFAPKMTSFFEEYFDVPYLLPKIDLVPIPGFYYGAMENWGLLTFSPEFLLQSGDNLQSKMQIAHVIAHELAHMWFGNLVNINFWDEVWLKEEFAHYFDSVGPNHIYPEWNLARSNFLEKRLQILRQDSLINTHAVQRDITRLLDVEMRVDQIINGKGSLMTLTMHNLLGEETFRKGLSRYLKKYQLKTANRYDLWDSLTTQAHLDGALDTSTTMQMIMEPWMTQPGHPIVTVTRNYETGIATVTQTRYVTGSEENRIRPECWMVPLTYTFEGSPRFSDTKPQKWLSCNASTLEIEMPSSNEWVIFNTEAAYLYRVNYDEQNWRLIAQTLNSDDYTIIPASTRAQIVGDALSLAFTGDLSYDIALDIVEYLKREKEYSAWEVASDEFDRLADILAHSESYSIFEEYTQDLLKPISAYVDTFTDEDIYLNDKYVLLSVIHKWKSTFRANNYVSPTTEEGALIERYRNQDLSGVAEILTSTTNQTLLSRFLAYSLETSEFSPASFLKSLKALLKNPNGFQVSQEFLNNNYERVLRRLSSNGGNLLKVIGSCIETPEELAQWRDFLRRNELDKSLEGEYAVMSEDIASSTIIWRATREEEAVRSMQRKINGM